MTPSIPIVSIESVTKRFGEFVALDAVDLTVGVGEVVCIIGPSGAGKSTLIRCINLLEDFAASGRISVDGVPVKRGPTLAAIRAEVGMVFQSFNLFPHKTVMENIILAPTRVRA
ncbi:MAG: ATP-binding cassette domain-containing protein, partial [Pseudomonadota bacterium]